MLPLIICSHATGKPVSQNMTIFFSSTQIYSFYSFTFKCIQHFSNSNHLILNNFIPLFPVQTPELKNNSSVFLSLTSTGNWQEKYKQHKHTCPRHVRGFFLLISVCKLKIQGPPPHPPTLIRGSGWSDYPTMDWEAMCVWASKHHTTFNAHRLFHWHCHIQLLPIRSLSLKSSLMK